MVGRELAAVAKVAGSGQADGDGTEHRLQDLEHRLDHLSEQLQQLLHDGAIHERTPEPGQNLAPRASGVGGMRGSLSTIAPARRAPGAPLALPSGGGGSIGGLSFNSPGDSDETIERTYHLPDGKLE